MQDNNILSPIGIFNPDDELKIDISKNQLKQNEQADLTDSDIDDPKYVPSSFNHQQINSKQIINNENKFQSPIINDTNFQTFSPNNNNNNLENQNLTLRISELNKVNKNLENENSMLKNSLEQLQEDLNVKNNIICEFQSLVKMSQDKFNKYEEANLDLKREIENLKKQIELKQNEVNDVKILSNRQETIIKNAEIYKENINNMQNDISNKEKELMKNFQNRENKLRNNFISENNQLNTKLDEFRVENEKLKFEISNLKLQIENLQSQIEEKNFEHDSELKKLEKENKKQNEKINEYEKKIPELESILENKSIDYESLISSLKLDNSNLLNELNVYKEKLVEAQGQILNQNHDIEILSIEASQNKINLSNKDAIIEQLKKQIEELGNEINEKENDLKVHFENKENDHVDFTKKINDIMKEKAKLETEKIELEHNLSIATEELKKMKDFINQSAFKENLKKEEIEKQYKNIINQMKNKEKKLYQENLCLRNTLNEKDCKIQNMNMSLYNIPSNNKVIFNKTNLNTPKRIENTFNYNEFSKINSPKISNSFNINNIPNNIIQNIHETNTYAFNTINPNNFQTSRNKNISINYKKFEDPNEENQLKTLEEFKKLLEKIDEKLDKPLILKGECC